MPSSALDKIIGPEEIYGRNELGELIKTVGIPLSTPYDVAVIQWGNGSKLWQSITVTNGFTPSQFMIVALGAPEEIIVSSMPVNIPGLLATTDLRYQVEGSVRFSCATGWNIIIQDQVYQGLTNGVLTTRPYRTLWEYAGYAPTYDFLTEKFSQKNIREAANYGIQIGHCYDKNGEDVIMLLRRPRIDQKWEASPYGDKRRPTSARRGAPRAILEGVSPGLADMAGNDSPEHPDASYVAVRDITGMIKNVGVDMVSDLIANAFFGDQPAVEGDDYSTTRCRDNVRS
jgi:hypothetical protein